MPSDHEDPLGVLSSAYFVAAHSASVSLDEDAIPGFAASLMRDGALAMPPDSTAHFLDDRARAIAYFFVIDAINFCFWGDPTWGGVYDGQRLSGYRALAAALTREARANPGFFDAATLAALDAESLGRALGGDRPIPLLEERAANLRELGRWALEAYGGDFAAVLEATQFDAIALAQHVIDNLPSFRDEAVYRGRVVRFYKRAQILAADLHGSLQARGWGGLRRVGALTVFADYKLPQLLRHVGVLRYVESLAEKVDHKVALAAGSAEEVEIRANTVWAAERVRRRLAQMGIDAPSHQIDLLLWLKSKAIDDMKPHHRTRTIFY